MNCDCVKNYQIKFLEENPKYEGGCFIPISKDGKVMIPFYAYEEICDNGKKLPNLVYKEAIYCPFCGLKL